MKTKILSMTEHTRGNSEVVVETPTGEMLTLGFMSTMPLRDEENYSNLICAIIDKYYAEKPEQTLLSFLFRYMAISYAEMPVFVQKDRNDERERMGKRIKEIRDGLGMEAKELAMRSGIDAANLCRIEQGRYSAGFDILTKIAYALNCKIDFVPLTDKEG